MRRSEDALVTWTKRFHWPVSVAALLVLPAVAIDASEAGGSLATLAEVLNRVIWLVFAAELAVLLAVAPDRRSWLGRNPLSIMIVVLTPPFAPAVVQGFRLARLLRVLRLLRLYRTLSIGRGLLGERGLQWAAVLAAATVIGGGAAFVEIEPGQHLSFVDGLWWAITAVTTVGYGDLSPHTPAGRLVGVAVTVTGVGFVALLTGSLARRFLVQTEEAADARVLDVLDDVVQRLERIEARLAEQEQP